MAQRNYYLLLVRDKSGTPWRPEFGDYDRAVVVAERQDRRDSGIRASHLRVISSNSANRECCDYCVATPMGTARAGDLSAAENSVAMHRQTRATD